MSERGRGGAGADGGGGHREYVVVYQDGPLAGGGERRVLPEDGEPEPVLDAFVAVEGIETRLVYRLVTAQHVEGEIRARYRFDPEGSDPIVEDREDGSGTISEVV